jgi:hypothetical protein
MLRFQIEEAKYPFPHNLFSFHINTFLGILFLLSTNYSGDLTVIQEVLFLGA